MEEQPHSDEPLADVIPIHGPRNVEYINGERLNLGQMTDDELLILAAACSARAWDANHDLAVVEEHIELRKS
jgi:hypothetical protein